VHSARLTLSLPPALLSRVRALAEAHGVSLAETVREALRSGIRGARRSLSRQRRKDQKEAKAERARRQAWANRPDGEPVRRRK